MGKYRDIVWAVALFLLFDLGVLLVNFATSYQISEDALGINLAGRQRMLSQRSAKALLAVEQARSQGQASPAALAELRDSVALFDATLHGFQRGATVPGGNGQPVHLPAAQGTDAVQAVQQAQALWAPYRQALAPVLDGQASADQLRTASAYAQRHNLALLEQMNRLTTALEASASQRATTLRQVQTAGIVLALLNFAFILFKFLRRLRRLDAGIEAVTRENQQILASVREGLFLVTPGFRLGQQMSQSAPQLLGRPLQPGDDFFALLASLVDGPALHDARNYVALLFAPHIKEALVQDINPLREVHTQVINRLGQAVPRTLALHFNRVHSGTAIAHVLVTVQDISDRSQLQAQLQAERQRAHTEIALLLAACAADPALLRQFVARSEAALLETNDLLRGGAQNKPALRQALDQAARRIHALKGDAGALGLDSLVHQAHAFETALLQALNPTHGDSGDPLLALPQPLEALLQRMAALKSLAGLPRGSDGQTGDSLNAALARLAQDCASAHGKRVATRVQLEALAQLPPEAAHLVREISTQLIRNAVVHGIEAPATRQASGKAAAGRVELGLEQQATQQDSAHGTAWTLRVHDDGRGLSPDPIRQQLLELGWYTAAQLDSFDARQIVGHIFKPGFSTAAATDVHAGRGLGLDLVQAHVQRLGGRLALASTPGQFTDICIRFEA